jgi:hypothetical protein
MLSEPWFRTSDGWWYAYVRENGGRRQIRLVKGEDRRDEAWDRWTELRQSLKRTGKLPSESAVTRDCANSVPTRSAIVIGGCASAVAHRSVHCTRSRRKMAIAALAAQNRGCSVCLPSGPRNSIELTPSSEKVPVHRFALRRRFVKPRDCAPPHSVAP